MADVLASGVDPGGLGYWLGLGLRWGGAGGLGTSRAWGRSGVV